VKKQFLIIGIVMPLLTIGLSGCTESTNKIDSRIELVNTWKETDSKFDFYKGTIKNIGGELLEEIIVKVNFYDSNNNFLFSDSDVIHNLNNSYTDEFSVRVYNLYKYYNYIDHIEYEITVS